MLQGLAVRCSQAIFTDGSVHLFARKAVTDSHLLVCLTALSNGEIVGHKNEYVKWA